MEGQEGREGQFWTRKTLETRGKGQNCTSSKLPSPDDLARCPKSCSRASTMVSGTRSRSWTCELHSPAETVSASANAANLLESGSIRGSILGITSLPSMGRTRNSSSDDLAKRGRHWRRGPGLLASARTTRAWRPSTETGLLDPLRLSPNCAGNSSWNHAACHLGESLGGLALKGRQLQQLFQISRDMASCMSD